MCAAAIKLKYRALRESKKEVRGSHCVCLSLCLSLTKASQPVCNLACLFASACLFAHSVSFASCCACFVACHSLCLRLCVSAYLPLFATASLRDLLAGSGSADQVIREAWSAASSNNRAAIAAEMRQCHEDHIASQRRHQHEMQQQELIRYNRMKVQLC